MCSECDRLQARVMEDNRIDFLSDLIHHYYADIVDICKSRYGRRLVIGQIMDRFGTDESIADNILESIFAGMGANEILRHNT